MLDRGGTVPRGGIRAQTSFWGIGLNVINNLIKVFFQFCWDVFEEMFHGGDHPFYFLSGNTKM